NSYPTINFRSIQRLHPAGEKWHALLAQMKIFETHSPEETVRLGHRIAQQLQPGSLTILRGDVGAGKTTLVKGIAEGLQAAEALGPEWRRFELSFARNP